MTSTKSRFVDLLESGWAEGKSVSVGLDGTPNRLPAELGSWHPVRAVVEFHRRIIEATAPLALTFKPQIAGYEAMGTDGPPALLDTIDLVHELAPGVPVIIDAKRADIGSTNDQYVDAIFGVYGADAVTVHPYLGPEAMVPFLDQEDKGIFVLCRTSNPGAGRYQDLDVGNGQPLYQHIAKDVATTWNANGNCGLVIGATYPEELRAVRALVGDLPVLVPGIGAQGGDLEATVKAGMDSAGRGLIIHASRALLYAYEQEPEISFDDATSRQMNALHNEIIAARGRV